MATAAHEARAKADASRVSEEFDKTGGPDLISLPGQGSDNANSGPLNDVRSNIILQNAGKPFCVTRPRDAGMWGLDSPGEVLFTDEHVRVENSALTLTAGKSLRSLMLQSQPVANTTRSNKQMGPDRVE